MKRFVVLHHTGWAGHLDHFDLMLDVGSAENPEDRALLTYSTISDDFPAPGIRFEKNADHRRAYLSYEGSVSGERGQVRRVDEGEIISSQWNSEAGHWVLVLNGRRLRGEFTLDTELLSAKR